ncbi:MAG: glycosyl transferase [Persephonella sp.]|nr:MAG: glycosyl transferase [Persephonella sp.]
MIRFSSLGDVILASSLLDPLYNLDIKVDFLTFKPFGEIFKEDYRLNKLIEVDKKELKTISQIKSFTNNLKKENYDYILDIHSNLRTFSISLFSRIKTIRYKKNSIKRRLFLYKPFRRFLINQNFNVLFAYLETLKLFGEKNYKKYRPRLILHSDDFKGVNNLPKNFVVIGSGARYKNKIYPYFNKVSQILLENGFNVVLVGSKDDKNLDRNVYPKEVIDLRGELSLRQSMAVISKAVGSISNDSAVAHLSRAVQTPVLMIYGATHPYFGFAPLEDEGDFIIKNLSCQPCDLHGRKECKFKSLYCLNIEPSLVVNKFLKILTKFNISS